MKRRVEKSISAGEQPLSVPAGSRTAGVGERGASVHCASLPEAELRRSERRRRMLVVDPDRLTRWSIATYLQRWFDVDCAPTAALADELLANGPVDVLVTSDDLSSEAVDRIERAARGRNAATRTVRMVADAARARAEPGVKLLEKPFALSRLAELAGVASDELFRCLAEKRGAAKIPDPP